MKYEIRIEKTSNGYSAYVPELPGCVAAAETREETERLIREAICFHLEGIMLQHSLVTLVDVTVSSVVAQWVTDNSPPLSVIVDVDAPDSRPFEGSPARPEFGFAAS